MDMGWRFVQPKFRPVVPAKVVHLLRWTSFFVKLFRLDRTDPLTFGPKFREILVEWTAPTASQERTNELMWNYLSQASLPKAFLACEQALLFGQAKRASRGAQIGELARMLRLYRDSNKSCLRRLEGGGYSFHVPCLELCVRCCKNFWPLSQWLDKHKRALSLVEQCRVTSWPCP